MRDPPKRKPPRARGAVLLSHFIPLAGGIKRAWLAGRYSAALAAVKQEALARSISPSEDFSAGSGGSSLRVTGRVGKAFYGRLYRVQSIRLVFPQGRVQRANIGTADHTWDDYLKLEFPKKAKKWIQGFQVRVARYEKESIAPKRRKVPRKTRLPWRDKRGRFAKKPRRVRSRVSTLKQTRSRPGASRPPSRAAGRKPTGRKRAGGRKKRS